MLTQTITKRRLGPSPCKDCQERTGECHAKCEKYAAWKEESDRYRNKIHDNQAAGAQADSFRINNMVKGREALKRSKKRRHTRTR